jgi:hypothetical protein
MSKNTSLTDSPESNLNRVYLLGAVTTMIVLSGTILDIVIGSITGGNLAALPQSAVDRFVQLHNHPLIGLYNLDLLNTIIQIFMIPTYFALYIAHYKVQREFGLLALIIFLVGTVIFVAGNVALPMFGLSLKYAASNTDSQRLLFSTAGEALLAKGIHGSLGVFFAFLFPNIAGILMSWVMLKGKVFSRVAGYLGLVGSILMVVYIIMVTFVSGIQEMATAFAAPGGIMLMAWLILVTAKLFKLRLKSAFSADIDHHFPLEVDHPISALN